MTWLVVICVVAILIGGSMELIDRWQTAKRYRKVREFFRDQHREISQERLRRLQAACSTQIGGDAA